MLASEINKKLEAGLIPARILASKFIIGTEPLRLFGDPTYLPFYYYLGKYSKKFKNLLEIGFELGMPSGCFMEGCKSIEHFQAFHRKDDRYYNKRFGVANIHNILKKKFNLWIGSESVPEFVKEILLYKWDCVLINDTGRDEKTYRNYLDLVWTQIKDDGLLVMDFLIEEPAKAAYLNFCKSQNLEPVILKTFRDTGLLKK